MIRMQHATTLTILLDMLLHHLYVKDAAQLRQCLQVLDMDDERSEDIIQVRAQPFQHTTAKNTPQDH